MAPVVEEIRERPGQRDRRFPAGRVGQSGVVSSQDRYVDRSEEFGVRHESHGTFRVGEELFEKSRESLKKKGIDF